MTLTELFEHLYQGDFGVIDQIVKTINDAKLNDDDEYPGPFGWVIDTERSAQDLCSTMGFADMVEDYLDRDIEEYAICQIAILNDNKINYIKFYFVSLDFIPFGMREKVKALTKAKTTVDPYTAREFFEEVLL